jgi:predicted nucleic acid-binding protein
MKQVFVDTSALIALGNKRDAFHQAAYRVNAELQRQRCSFVTTGAVVFEFGNAFSPLRLRQTAITLIRALRESERWTCMPLDDRLFQKAFERFQHVRDKEWGLVDCLSMIVAEEASITEIFTTDHHFEQAGFRILLPQL